MMNYIILFSDFNFDLKIVNNNLIVLIFQTEMIKIWVYLNPSYNLIQNQY